MNRRELVAGLASVGILGGSAAILRRGFPVGSDDTGTPPEQTTSDDPTDDSAPLELRTLEVPGSDAGTIEIPNDGLTIAVAFSPVCQRCQASMPELAAARERLTDAYGDAITVVSITNQQTEDQLRSWWVEHDGDWTLAFDPDRSFVTAYDIARHPVVLAIDADGTVRWEDDGVLEADRIVSEVSHVLENDGDGSTE
ncbi:TlpA family protein disulfide reductase [Salinadaptatus halalkaliphilus]|uniref:TlpA family protein disulfide reductase n=1 Tax=Salinadaptatus halalkaliphilus TaxID=2419781 RepID=A0A4S3TKH9_9EURY|nr:redoxin family protein [Salinadaptatus halalkaliphilus]THE63078.1 TlpA family protein disulfide reductase [Salinadaptatus halalkaliphilus]